MHSYFIMNNDNNCVNYSSCTSTQYLALNGTCMNCQTVCINCISALKCTKCGIFKTIINSTSI
jgi:hypothetical protein